MKPISVAIFSASGILMPVTAAQLKKKATAGTAGHVLVGQLLRLRVKDWMRAFNDVHWSPDDGRRVCGCNILRSQELLEAENTGPQHVNLVREGCLVLDRGASCLAADHQGAAAGPVHEDREVLLLRMPLSTIMDSLSSVWTGSADTTHIEAGKCLSKVATSLCECRHLPNSVASCIELKGLVLQGSRYKRLRVL